MKPRLVLLVAALAVSCTGGESPPPGPAQPAPSSTSAPPAYDPPRRFTSSGVSIGNGPVAVADGVAYSLSDTGLVATELSTGTRRWSVPLREPSNQVGGPPGILTDDTGQQLIVAAYLRPTKGTGTQQDSTDIRVVAVDPNGKTRWEVSIERPATSPRVAGGFRDGRGSAVVIDAADTVVLDLANGTVRWTAQRVKPSGVDADTVLGVRAGEERSDPWTAVALRGSDGGQLWAGPQLRGTVRIGAPPAFIPTGHGRAIISGQGDDFGAATAVLDTQTGEPVASIPGVHSCLFDERDVTVCFKQNLVIGLDARTGKQLWKLPDEAAGRTGIKVSAAFHGAVYGMATRSSVILDARTGADIETNVHISPDQVFPGYGIVIWTDNDDAASAYRATS